MIPADPPKGLVYVLTGNGKGKTCSAVGMSVRALGRGMKVLLIQFLKPEGGSGETLFLKGADRFASLQFGTGRFIGRDRIQPDDILQAERGLEAAETAVRGREWDMVILDEILQAADFGLVSVDRILGLMSGKSESVELVLTGRSAPEAVIERADLVSEIREVKHPHRSGLRARRGIEF